MSEAQPANTTEDIESTEISAQVRSLPDRGEVTAYYDLPTNLDAAVELFGHDAVYSRFKASLIIDIQAFMRGMMNKGKTDDEIRAAVSNWKPGVKVAGKTPKEKIADLFSKLSAEERAELLAKFTG